MTTTTRPSVREAAARLAEHGIEAAQAYDRPDLADPLERLRAVASTAGPRVLVAGEFKQGKSSLVNALVGEDVCPVDEDVATAVATVVRHAGERSSTALTTGDDGEESRVPVPIDELGDWVTEAGGPREPAARVVEVGVPAEVLRGGLQLVDLPGAGGLGSVHGAATLAALHHASAIVFASDAVQDLTAPELAFLRQVAERCGTVALAKTKIDIHPHWQAVVERDGGHSSALGATVLGVSAELAAKARASDDEELLAESGLPALQAWLRDHVVAGADQRLAVDVAEQVLTTCELLRAPFDAERAVLDDPSRQAELQQRLEAAAAEATRLKDAASRWQQLLADAFTDITADADHDLRQRVRDLLRRNEEAIDGFDPAEGWEEYEPVLRREVSSVVADHFALVHERMAAAARQVAEVFAEDADGVDDLLRTDRGDPITDAAAVPDPAAAGNVKRLGVGGQVLALARGSYSPSLMFGFLGGIAGITIAAPALLAVGLVAGGKGLRTEKQRRLVARQSQAKASARKFVDEVVFQVGKDSRDEVRRAQRALRAHFSARADELVRSANAALSAAQAAARAGAPDARRSDVDAELERIEWLADLARRVRTAVEPAS